jgi:hypothetical protein
MGDMALPAGQAWHPMGGTSGRPPRTVFDESWYTFDAVASFDGVRVAGVLLVHLLALAMWPSPWWAGLAGLLVAVDGVHIVHVHLHHRRCPLRRARVPAAATASRSRPWPATGSSGPATCSGPACCWGRRGDQVDGAARPGSRDRPWGGRRAQPARAESSAPLSWPLLAHPIRYVWDSAAGRQVVPAGNPLLYGPWLVIPSTRLLFDMLPAGRPVHGPGAGSVWGWAWPRCWPRWRTRRSGPMCRYPPAGCGSSRSSAF